MDSKINSKFTAKRKAAKKNRTSSLFKIRPTAFDFDKYFAARVGISETQFQEMNSVDATYLLPNKYGEFKYLISNKKYYFFSQIKKHRTISTLLHHLAGKVAAGNGGNGGDIINIGNFNFDFGDEKRPRLRSRSRVYKNLNQEKLYDKKIKCQLYINTHDEVLFNKIFKYISDLVESLNFKVVDEGDLIYGSLRKGFTIYPTAKISKEKYNEFYKKIEEFFKPLLDDFLESNVSPFLRFIKENIEFGNDIIFDFDRLLIHSVSIEDLVNNEIKKKLIINKENQLVIINEVRNNIFFNYDTFKIYSYIIERREKLRLEALKRKKQLNKS